MKQAVGDSGIITSNVYDGEIYERLNPFVEKITGILFRRIDFDKESLRILKEYQGGDKNIVYASYHGSNISLLILYNILKKHNFPPPVFALEYNPFLLQKAGYVWKRILKNIFKPFWRRKYSQVLNGDYVKQILWDKKSIILSLMSKRYFLKRYTEIKYDSLKYLIEIQKEMDEPIYLFPQMIFWNRNPERSSKNGPIWMSQKDIMSSRATGDKGLLFGWLNTLRSMAPAFVRLAKPLNLKEFIESSKTNDPRQIAFEVRNQLLGIYHHKKRSILGPVLKSQQEMMERVLYNRNVLDKVTSINREDKIPEKKLRRKAYRYYKEIAATFSIKYIIFASKLLDYLFNRIYDGIQYDLESIREIRDASKKGPLIILPCHKSHMDYLIVSYLFHRNNLFPPFVAAGVNLSFFPLGFIFRKCGAFFLRRSFKGLKLYPAIFKQYVKNLISEGYGIEFFIEGGRTRTGKLVLPKLGFLSYVIEAIEEGYHKDVVFIPVSINYDRVMEEQTYARELRGTEKKSESVGSVISSSKILKRKYGRVYVTFNRHFSLREMKQGNLRDREIAPFIANEIVRRINDVTIVTPYALVATAILISSLKGFPHDLLIKCVHDLYKYLKKQNVIMSESLSGAENLAEITDSVLKTYLNDRIIGLLRDDVSKKNEVMEGFYTIREDDRIRLIFYKNNIIHYLVPLSIVSAACLYCLRQNGNGSENPEIIFKYLKTLLSKEFVYSKTGENADGDIYYDTVDYLVSESILTGSQDNVVINESATENIKYFARIIYEYLESYLIVLHTILDQKVVHKSRKDLVTEIRRHGVKLYHSDKIRLAEALSMPNYQTAIDKFAEMNILVFQTVSERQTEITSVEKDRVLEIYTKLKQIIECIQ